MSTAPPLLDVKDIHTAYGLSQVRREWEKTEPELEERIRGKLIS